MNEPSCFAAFYLLRITLLAKILEEHSWLKKKERKKKKRTTSLYISLSLSLFLFPQDFLGACDLSLPYLTSPQNISFQTQFQALIPEHLKPLFFYLSYRFINPDFLEMLLLEL